MVEPVPSTVRSSGRDTQVERDSCQTCMPLVTSKPCVLNARDSSLPRKTIVFATSSTVGKVRIGGAPPSERASAMVLRKSVAVVPEAALRSLSIAPNTVRMRSLAIGPGYTIFTRMPRLPTCSASWRENAFIAAFGTT